MLTSFAFKMALVLSFEQWLNSDWYNQEFASPQKKEFALSSLSKPVGKPVANTTVEPQGRYLFA